jgi:hypothetical protein
MSFDVTCRQWPNTGAVPIIALQFPGVPAGSSVPLANGAPTATRAAYCWAGTATDAQVSFQIAGAIDKGDGTPLSGSIALWADPTVATVAMTNGTRWVSAPGGQLGHQDEPYC